ncbi:FGGY-family carbohydrate kinase [Micromonospora yangpuensis]|uniref:Sugar (Pentulose or hexulose) kinase n=1 Tax=Micromonospora yangpuensis TaxID=683228 RepID=A0A1C6U4C4_9ACTN|nr:FGGY family carbohydrate kinase [Micromonospora yangpuensis]GGL92645.1 carbohydrate kinase [Micromonospora yangpuensis]SCL48920.1 Sugar (pentulose or hexulose) kinase [Micromonospora yangpuensis]
MKPTITIDIGTTRVKLGFFDAGGDQLASDKQPTPSMADSWGSVYDVDALLAIIVRFVGNLDPGHRDSVERIAIAGVGESGGLVGPDLVLRSPMILWHDQRGAAMIDGLDRSQRTRIYKLTGLPPNANYSLSKIAWAAARTGHATGDLRWLNVSEYVAAWMTGRRWAEYSLASRTMALDLRAGEWSPEMCTLAGLDPALLPELCRADQGQEITPGFAREANLPATVTVHVAGHDHMVGAVGAGLRKGEVLNSTGTTEGVLLLNDRPSLDAYSARSMLANGLACDGSAYTLFASIPTGGSAFATLQRMLGMSESMLATCVAALSERYLSGQIDLAGVPVVIPQFRGSPPPDKSASARGIIANLGNDVRAEDIVFGCFLGLAIQFAKVLELFRTDATTIKVIGPASQNRLWLHLKADILDADLSVSEFPEVVSRGAQALASGRAGNWESCDPAPVLADPARHARLQEWRESVRPVVHNLGQLSW